MVAAAGRRGRRPRAERPHVVAALVLDGVSLFELAVPAEVFGIDRSDLADPWYEFKACAGEPPPLSTTGGFTIDTPYGLDDFVAADTVVVLPGLRAETVVPGVVDAIVEAHRRGARIVSVCTGAFLLAATGLLDGRRATTHWARAGDLTRMYPKVAVDPRVLYVDEGDILTSAGTASGIDLCLHLVRLDHGADVANAVARRMVVPPHRDGGQAQFVEAPVPEPTADPVGEVMAWMLEHLDEPLAVDELASRAAMSPRTFARRFRAVTGTTPHQWLLGQRILLAQRLLETTDDSIELVAWRCGMGTAANLRAHFQRAVGTSPLAYRRVFRQAAAVDLPA